MERMASSFISKLPKGERQALLDDLNYLNISEIRSFCKRHSIPYRIAIETKDGRRSMTRDDDRKGVILNRIRHFLQTGVILNETCFPAAVVCFDQLSDHITADDRLFYGQYDKTNRTMITLLKSLTDGQLRMGPSPECWPETFGAAVKPPHSVNTHPHGATHHGSISGQIRSGLSCRTEQARGLSRIGRNYGSKRRQK
jgi:hypothetical protein